MTTETERTALVERHVLALMDDGSPSGPDECRYVTLAMARSAIAAAVTEALASAPSAPQPTEEPSIEGLVMTAQHYLGADFGTPPPDKRASFLLAAIHHLGGALRGMVEAYTAKRDAYERMRANYEMSAEARAVRSIAAMLGWENVPPQDVLEDDIRALKARVQVAEPSPLSSSAMGEKQESDPYAKMATLQPNWDSYGAAPIDTRAIEAARSFEATFWRVPTCNGGVQLEWHALDIDLEVAIASDGTVEGVFVHHPRWELESPEAQPSPAPPDPIASAMGETQEERADDPIAAAVDAQLDPLKDELIAMGHKLAKSSCKVREAGMTDPPQDCDWPFCGCDEHATKVIDTLQECGWGPR
jgi:hypothetical protein